MNYKVALETVKTLAINAIQNKSNDGVLLDALFNIYTISKDVLNNKEVNDVEED